MVLIRCCLLLRVSLLRESAMYDTDRWNSPVKYTLAYRLFKQHFTEINRAYWAFIPVENTIKAQVKREVDEETVLPVNFFLLHDEDDDRIARSFHEWRDNFSLFGIYTRLNMLMMLSSCQETYLRTVVSMAVESKPGIILGAPNSIDGLLLLKKNKYYSSLGNDKYQFKHKVDSVCSGTWKDRRLAYDALFGSVLDILNKNIEVLEEMRIKRNIIAHYFGRDKKRYEAPILLNSEALSGLSHATLIKFLKAVFDVSTAIDQDLRTLIGSYDIILFFRNYEAQYYSKSFDINIKVRARELSKRLGKSGVLANGSVFCYRLLSYYYKI